MVLRSLCRRRDARAELPADIPPRLPPRGEEVLRELLSGGLFYKKNAEGCGGGGWLLSCIEAVRKKSAKAATGDGRLERGRKGRWGESADHPDSFVSAVFLRLPTENLAGPGAPELHTVTTKAGMTKVRAP